MKKCLLSLFMLFTLMQSLSAQTGPAGVGSSTNNLLWLAADNLSLSNNDGVSSWTDASGNSNNADQATAGFQPTFLTNQINGLPVISFDGTDDRLDLTSTITSDDITTFMVYTRPSNGAQTILNLNQHIYFTENNKASMIYSGSGTRHSVAKTNNSYSVYSMQTDNGVSSGNLDLFNGTSTSNASRAALYNNPGSVVGSRLLSPASHNLFFEGEIAEIIIFDEVINSAQRRIISAHLGAKYDLTPETIIFSHGSTHGSDVMGIGQESDGSNTSARGTDDLEISNASALGNGDYILVGNDDGGYATSTSAPAGIVERWTQVWRADVTGTPGTIDVEFFLDAGNFAAPSNYVVLIETNDGDFSNGNVTQHSAGRIYSVGNNSISFTGLNIGDGDYFTLAEIQSDITAVADGDWDQTATWSCTCIPGNSDIVLIGNTFDVAIDADAEVVDLTIESGGSLDFSGSNSLSISGDLSVSGTLTTGTGTIIANAVGDQAFDNGSVSTIALHNLTVSNGSGLNINSGDWSLSSDLTVSSGGLDVTNATSFTLLSDASTTSQVRTSMDNAFTGNFTVQRYISARNTNYSNLAAPITDATAADLDDDLFISGIGGTDGNATVGGGGIFYSIYGFNNSTQLHEELTATTDALTNSRGYEVYLATTLSTFNATTVDFEGSLKSGSATRLILQGWNLIGNPYHSHVNYDDVTKTVFIPNEYYIFNTDNGSYDLITGGSKPAIPPSQGFWIFKTAPGGNNLVFEEADKANSTSSSFTRRKFDQNFELEISSTANPFKHKMQIQFNPNAKSSIDEEDSPFLESPIKEAPGIFSFAANGNQALVKNSINANEEVHSIPISVYTGTSGQYSITANGKEQLLDTYSCVYLKDKETDEHLDLNFVDTYNFESNGQGEMNRFQLVMSNSYEKCMKVIENNEGHYQFKIEDQFDLRRSYDNWFLDYTFGNENSNVEITVYSVSGQEVIQPVHYTLFGAGTLPLQQLNELRGVYLIQIKSNDELLNKTVKL